MNERADAARPQRTLGAALDLGTARATCWIAERNEDGIAVLAAGEAPSEGVRAGEVVDVRAASRSVLAAIEEAEARSGLTVQGVCAALSGAAITGTPGRAAEPVTREGQVITPAEVRRALERAGSVTLPKGALKLHILPQAFMVDGAGPVRNPVGLAGAILEAQVIVISGSAFAAENLSRAVRHAGRQIASVVAAPAALGLGALTDEERELGGVAVDLGAGLTGYAAWKDGGLHACGAVPVGGDLLTRDVAVGLGLTREAAEGVKCGATSAIAASGPRADAGWLDAPSHDEAGGRRLARGGLPEIVEARVEEMLLLVERRLAGLDHARDFAGGVALAGGGARLEGIAEMTRRVLGAPVRVARPRLAGVEGVDLSVPENALGAGLLRWSFDGAPQVETRQAPWGTRWLASAVRWLAAGFLGGRMSSRVRHPDAPRDAPVVIGIGGTGLRIVSRLAAREARAIRCLVVLGGAAPAGPTAVPTIAWREGSGAPAPAGQELRERLDGARAAVLVLGLAAQAAATVAPDVMRAARPHVRMLAAVGVAPFSFEGPAASEAAESATRAIGALADLLAVAEREGARAAVPPETPLERACAFVDEAAALAAETLAVAAGGVGDLCRLFGGAQGLRAVGAGEATGSDAAARATRAAVGRSLLSAGALLGSREAVLLLAAGRTPTLGEIGFCEEALRGRLAQGADLTVRVATEAALGARALAAVVCAAAGVRGNDAFPSEDPATLEIPAFLRKRSGPPPSRVRPLRRAA